MDLMKFFSFAALSALFAAAWIVRAEIPIKTARALQDQDRSPEKLLIEVKTVEKKIYFPKAASGSFEVAQAPATEAKGKANAEKTSAIRLAQIDGRTWLVDPGGRAFFAHGVTHLVAKHGSDVATVGEACKELGFNAYGYGCPEALKTDLPYLEGRQLVPMSTYRTDGSFAYVDIFDPKVQAKLEGVIKNLCLANRENPNLIGYCWTDLGAWSLKNSTGKNWVEAIRNLPADAPGRKVYRAFLETWKGDNPTARDLAFLRRIASEYFRVLGEANRKFDPDHLIFGDRFSFPNVVPEVIEEMLPYVDAIAIQPRYQPVFPAKEFDRIHQLSGKPIIICDFAIRFQDGDKKIRGWKPSESPKLAGEQYSLLVHSVLTVLSKRDYFVQSAAQ